MSDNRKRKSTINKAGGAKKYRPTETGEGSTWAEASTSHGDLGTAVPSDGFVGQPKASSETSEKLPMEEELPDDHANNSENSISQTAAPDSAPEANEMAPKSEEGRPIDSKKGNDADHGNRFQSKLLVLFFLRAINRGYDFWLGTELPDQGAKFDDLIFKYRKKVKESDRASSSAPAWPYQYLQAKHRLKEDESNKIKKSCLLSNKKNEDFNVVKYFRSYLELSGRGVNIDSCIICTNVDIDQKLVAKAEPSNQETNGAQEEDNAPKILSFDGFKKPMGKVPALYNLEDTPELRNELKFRSMPPPVKVKDDEINEFFKKFVLAVNTPNEDELTEILKDELKNYFNLENVNFQSAYIYTEMVDWFKRKDNIWLSAAKGKELFQNKVKENMDSLFSVGLSIDYQEKLKSGLSFSNEAVKEMAEKLKPFLMKTNTDELEYYHIPTPAPEFTAVKVIAALRHKALETEDFKREDSYLVTASSSLNEGEAKKWIKHALMKNEKTKLLIIVRDDDSKTEAALVNEIQNLKEKKVIIIGKDENASSTSPLLDTISYGQLSDQSKFNLCSKTVSFQRNPSGEATGEDLTVGQLIVSSDQLGKVLDELNFEEMAESITSKKKKEGEQKTYAEDLKKQCEILKEKGIVKWPKDMDEDLQKKIWGKIVEITSVKNILDASSIGELVSKEKQKKKIEIPSYSASPFEQSLYIDRKVRFNFDFSNTFWEEVAQIINNKKKKGEPKTTAEKLKEQIDSKTGRIEWNKDTSEDRKEEVWKKIREKARNLSAASSSSVVDALILEENWERRAMILTGVAGTGKSTVLSHFYDEIKKKNHDHWVIRIDLKHHFKDLENYKLDKGTTKLCDAIDFIASLPTVVDNQSPFANSLLRHRLETGDRVVLMFDGYDELNNECQKKAAQIMEILAEKSVRLYVTTRPHMVEELQSELDQLAYTLEHFDRDDKVKCMSSFWINKMNIETREKVIQNHNKSQLEKDPLITLSQKEEETNRISSNGMQATALSVEQRERLTGMAESIVDGLSADLKDKEESFIGIPLQCRILAECFLQEARQWSGGTDAIQIKDIVDAVKKLDVASLYRKLMEKKRQIFLEEKGIIETGHPIVGGFVDLSINQIECCLTELAIHTIVSNETDAEILWPPLPFQSFAGRQKQMNKLNELNIRFGLVDRVYSASCNEKIISQLQFLHRTYAEYLMAKYLCKGFQIDDEKHNKLLNNESVRKLIVDEIFVKDEYYGVRIFLDSMLKEIVNSGKWQQMIGRPIQQDQNEPLENKAKKVALPDHLEKIADTGNSKCYIRAIETKNSYIFVFLFDCLQATSNEGKIKEIVESAFKKGIPFRLYYEQSSQVFERLMKNYDASDEDKVFFILNEMLRDVNRTANLAENCIEWKHNRTERDKILELLFNFMAWAKENGRLNKFLDPNRERAHRYDSGLLRILICKNGYEDRSKQYLDVYLNFYPHNDNVLVDLLATSFELYDRFFDVNDPRVKKPCTSLSLLEGKIKKILFIIKNHGRNEVLKRISRFVLKRDPGSFREFYKPIEPTEEEGVLVPENMKTLLEQQDSAGMTCLHRAVYHGNTKTVDQILKWIIDNQANPEAKVVTSCLAVGDNALTPFYVAHVCATHKKFDTENAHRHREIGTKILECLNQVFTKKKLKKHMTDENGFLRLALKETFIFDETEMMEWILTEINRIFGSDLLYCVLRSRYHIRYDKPREKFMEVTANLLTDHYTKKELYKKVSDLVFLKEGYVKKMLPSTAKDTLEKMIEADGGIGNWIKRFFTIEKGYKCLNDVIASGIIELNEDARQQLVEDGKSTLKEMESQLTEQDLLRDEPDVPGLFQCIQLNVGEEALSKVLLHNDGASVTRISLLHRMGGVMIKIIQLLLSDKKYREQVAERIIHHAITMIPEILRQPNQPSHFYLNCMMGMSPLIVDYANNQQLLDFVDVILRKPNDRDPSIWSQYLQDKGLSNSKVQKFLDCVSQKLGVEAGQRLRKQDVA